MKIIFTLWLLLACPFISFSQVLTVTDRETGEPIETVTLSSDHPRAHTITNPHGKADVSAFAGAASITVRSLGYRTVVTNYTMLDSAGFSLSLTPSVFAIDETVVTATRWDQSAYEVPARITSLSPREVSLQNPQTAADLLGVTGLVFIQKSQQGGGSPMIRGFATNRLLYTVDGVRMNTAIFRGGNIQNVISLDPFAIEKTEVVFGPSSLIYGSDAIGGVMGFRTLTPEFSLSDKPLISGKAVTRYSSANNEKTEHFDLNLGWKKFSMLTSISSFDFGDLKMGSFGPDEYLRPFYVQRTDSQDVVIANEDRRIQRPSGYSQINMMQKVRFRPGRNWDLQYGFHYSETSDYARYDRHIRYRNGRPRYGEWSYGPQKWMMNGLQVSHTGQNVLYDELTLRLARQYFEESRISRDFNDPLREVRTEKVDANSLNLDLVKSTEQKRVMYGIEAVRDEVSSKGTNTNVFTGTSVTGPARYPQSNWTSLAFYGSDQYRLSQRLMLQAGLRYNLCLLKAEFDTTFYPFPFTEAEMNNGALTGNLGLVMRPGSGWTFRALASTAFRSPNIDDVGKVFDSEPGSVVVPNPDLEAEYAWNGELGVTRVFDEVVKADLTGYVTLLNHALVRRNFTLNGKDSIVYDGTLSRVQAIQNAAEARVYGFQAGVEVRLPANFSCSSAFNYQKGQEELDDGSTSPSRHAAPWFGTGKVKYAANGLVLEFYTVYSGPRKFVDMPEEEKGKDYIYATDTNGHPWSPGWMTLNMKAMYRLSNQISVSAGMENLTDKRYRPYSSGLVAPGRNFILSARVHF